MNPIARYTRWLHTQWPAGTVEQLPVSGENGATAIPGVRIVGDLTGIPLLKFSSATGSGAVRAILAEPDFRKGAGDDETYDLAIIGGGVSGVSAAIEAHRAAPGFAVYAAAKAAVENLSRRLALELADRRIRVNALAPDAIPTPGDDALADDLR